MHLHIVDRISARKAGLKRYFTGEPCLHGHLAERQTIDTKCLGCKRKKDINYYGRNKQKIVDKVADWSKENPEKHKQYYETWKTKNKERYSVITRNIQHRHRARKRGTEVVFSPEVTEWVISQNKVCRYCGNDCKDQYEIDHFYPISKGGKHEISNLIICCPRCNRSKHTKDPISYLKEIRNAK